MILAGGHYKQTQNNYIIAAIINIVISILFVNILGLAGVAIGTLLAMFYQTIWMACLLYTSYYPEGVPRSVLQALASGRPVITFNTPGCKETVKNGVNGFVVEKKDIKALAEKMIWMIEHPKRCV